MTITLIIEWAKTGRVIGMYMVEYKKIGTTNWFTYKVCETLEDAKRAARRVNMHLEADWIVDIQKMS